MRKNLRTGMLIHYDGDAELHIPKMVCRILHILPHDDRYYVEEIMTKIKYFIKGEGISICGKGMYDGGEVKVEEYL